MLQTMYAEEDAEDERLLAELIELRLQAAERELQHSPALSRHRQCALAMTGSTTSEQTPNMRDVP